MKLNYNLQSLTHQMANENKTLLAFTLCIVFSLYLVSVHVTQVQKVLCASDKPAATNQLLRRDDFNGNVAAEGKRYSSF